MLIDCNIAGVVNVNWDQMYWRTGWGGIPMTPEASVGEPFGKLSLEGK